MSIAVIFSLQDHTGAIYKEIPIEFSETATLKHLMEKIASIWQIKEEHLELIKGSEQLLKLNSTLQQIGLQENDKIVVKHALLGLWKRYVSLQKEFNQTYENERKKELATKAQKYHGRLLNSDFFGLYVEFDQQAQELHRSISKYLDKKVSPMKEATEKFFEKKFANDMPVLDFKLVDDGDDESGTRSAIICDIKREEQILQTYRIKTNHDAGDRNSGFRCNIDLLELYCYKLLESIGVGAKIVFIPNVISSRSIIYIGSEWITDFCAMKKIDDDQMGNASELTDALVQIQFLATYLSFGDMHPLNFGINKKNWDPIIVDFFMSDYENSREKFLQNDTIRELNSNLSKLLSNCDATNRLQIAKKSIERWNFLEKLDETLKLMEKEKSEFYRDDLDFAKKTRDLENFVSKVKAKVQDLLE